MNSRWRPKNRRTILQLEDEGSQSPVTVAPSAAANKLQGLLGHYNSDDDDGEKSDGGSPNTDADTQYQDLMNEIKQIGPAASSSEWQELWDPQSGHPYYWNPTSNELTWEKPIIATKCKQLSEEAGTVPESLPEQEPESAALRESSDTKISFKLVQKSETPVNKPAVKESTTRFLDADTVIAEIEKEVPPDYKTFVPLFRRRKVEASSSASVTLRNCIEAKIFFQSSTATISSQLSREAIDDSEPQVLLTHRGFGYRESDGTASALKKDQMSFVQGETLVPWSPEPEPVLKQKLTLPEKLSQLEEKLVGSNDRLEAQLQVLKEAWQNGKLDSEYFESWLDSKDCQEPAAELPAVSKEMLTVKPDTTSVSEGELPPSTTSSDQVIDMVLDDSGSESGRKSEQDDVGKCLDTALDSFYSDLAALDAVPETFPSAESIQVSDQVEAVEVVKEENVVDMSRKVACKRSKMSTDMSSLVAKWQKIHEDNT